MHNRTTNRLGNVISQQWTDVSWRREVIIKDALQTAPTCLSTNRFLSNVTPDDFDVVSEQSDRLGNPHPLYINIISLSESDK
jgi:hypothetical protein